MNAINLIPAEEQRAARVGRSGGAVYAVIGALVVLVVLASAYALAARSVTSKRAQLADVTRQAEQAEAVAGDLERYVEFAKLREARVATVRDLAAARFDWARVLREVSRTIPADASLTSLSGTTGAASAAGTAAGTAAGAAPATPGVPSVAIQGCTSGQERVAKLMVSLRRIDGVARVTLVSSAREGAAGGSAASAGTPAQTSSACTMKFSMNLTLSAPATGAASTTTGSAKGVTP
jgi:Tfp pilus assembly protein PilN